MRWFVEVSSLSAPAGTVDRRHTVEAATWQGALAQARSAGGDAGPLANFTIEVLPDGYRATNALARTRYVVAKAPDDAPVTVQPAGTPAPPAAHPGAASPAAVAANVLAKPASSLASTMVAVTADPKPEPPRPAAAAAPVAAAPVVAAPVVAAPAAVAPAAVAPAAAAPRGSLPGKILLRRAEEPGARSPLTYRELAIAVADSTPEPVAVDIARAHLAALQAELAPAPPGRFVQLAVFDHEWTGRPERGPVVKLTWKDWRGEPELKVASAGPVSMPQSSPSQSMKAVDPRALAQEISSAVEAARPVAVAPARVDVPAAIEAVVAAPVVAAPIAPAPAAAPAAPAAPAVVPAAPPSPAVVVAPAPAVAPAAPAAPVHVAAAAPAIAPAPAAPSMSAAGAPSHGSIKRPPTPMGAPTYPGRPADLIGEVFEAMHDIHFMQDSLDGADFVLELLREKLPMRAAMLYFFDMNTKELVVVKSRGPNGAAVLGTRTPEADPFLGAALRSGRANHVRDAAREAGWSRPRYAALGHPDPHEILVVPIRHHRRYLGMIEIADHVDGKPFTENEEHAVVYVAEQFAEFLSERGVKLVAGDTGNFQALEPITARRR